MLHSLRISYRKFSKLFKEEGDHRLSEIPETYLYFTVDNIWARRKQLDSKIQGHYKQQGHNKELKRKIPLFFLLSSFPKQWRMVWWQSSSSRIIWRRQSFWPGPQPPLGKGPFAIGLQIFFPESTPESVVKDIWDHTCPTSQGLWTRAVKADSSILPQVEKREPSLKKGKRFSRPQPGCH